MPPIAPSGCTFPRMPLNLPANRSYRSRRPGKTRLIQEHRVNTGHERLTGVVAAGEVPSDHFIGDRQEATVGTLRALYTRLFADAAYPLVGARGCVAGLPCFPTLESAWIHVLAPAKERAEQCDLFVRRGELMDLTWTPIH